MPFGSESTGDDHLVGPILFRDKHPSPMPFGSESTGDPPTPARALVDTIIVTNAFRQRVHWGPSTYEEQDYRSGNQVTNAFRQRVHWGRHGAKHA